MTDLDIRKLLRVVEILEELEAGDSIASELAYKYALLECCGWIEEKMHYILFQYVENQTTNIDMRNLVKATIKNKKYSFKYSDFRIKFECALGELHVLRIEKHLSGIDDRVFDFLHFKQYLSELKKQRDRYAHTYSRVGHPTAMGFTELRQRIDYINGGLNRISRCVRNRFR